MRFASTALPPDTFANMRNYVFGMWCTVITKFKLAVTHVEGNNTHDALTSKILAKSHQNQDLYVLMGF